MGLAIAGSFAAGYIASAGSRAVTPVAAPGLVDEVRSALASRYYRPVPDSVLRLRSVRQIISALDDPYTTYLGPRAYKLVRQETASSYNGIGVSVLPDDALDAIALMKHADTAMYAAKQAGKNTLRFYSAIPANDAGLRSASTPAASASDSG